MTPNMVMRMFLAIWLSMWTTMFLMSVGRPVESTQVAFHGAFIACIFMFATAGIAFIAGMDFAISERKTDEAKRER